MIRYTIRHHDSLDGKTRVFLTDYKKSFIMGSPDLVIQIEDKFYDWQNAAPLIMAYLVYKTSLPVGSVQSLNEIYL